MQIKNISRIEIGLILILLCRFELWSQGNLTPDIDGPFEGQVFVVTNRVIDTVDQEGLVLLNEVDITQPLKYLKVTYESGSWFLENYPDLATMLNGPSPFHDWAVWVHGDGQSFLLSMKRAVEIQHLHGVNMIVFSWPTRAPDKGPVGNYKNSMRNAGLSAPYLGQFISELAALKKVPGGPAADGNLSIFFHSLANYLLLETLEGGHVPESAARMFDNLVINAAAVNSEGHHDFLNRLNIQKRLYVCFNDEDINLEGLRVISSLGTQLGEKPLPPFSEQAIYVDFTAAVGSQRRTGATHSYYYDYMTTISENIRMFYTDLFHGRPADFSDTTRFYPSEGKIRTIRF